MNARLLIVDDEPNVLEPLIDFFLAEGYEVDGARDGAEALERARAQRPDCVLLDVNLPKKDGIAVCRELRQEEPLLPSVSHVIVDEAHERTADGDFLLMVLRRTLAVRDDLKGEVDPVSVKQHIYQYCGLIFPTGTLLVLKGFITK